MNIPLTSPHFIDQPRAPTGSPNELMSEAIGQGIAKIFDLHWAEADFVSELASGGYEGLDTMHLLNEMMNNWIDAEPETVNRLTAKDRAAMELASWAWKLFFRVCHHAENIGPGGWRSDCPSSIQPIKQ